MDVDTKCVRICAHAPQIDDLCCIVCELDPIEVQDSSAKSSFHWKTMKCRYFIYVAPEIIAAPVEGTEGSIFVIMNKTYYMSGVCDHLLKKLNLKFGGVRTLTTEVYRICISFTIQCKIAPSWNRVGFYYLAGKNFFNDATKAMDFDVFVDDKHVHFKLHPWSVKLRYMHLENLYLSSKQIAEFLADPIGFINMPNCGSVWVHVLPSMKRGRVLSISKTIPRECPFKDFVQLRRHWKNMYGYFLPKNEKDVIYYQIKFPVQQSSPFTYPHFCILPERLQIIDDKDKEATIKYFLAAVYKAIPSICGEQLKFTKCDCQTMITPFTGQTRSARISLPKSAVTNNMRDEEFVSSAKVEFSANYFRNVRAGVLELQSPVLKLSQNHKTSKGNPSSTNARNEIVDSLRIPSTSTETKKIENDSTVPREKPEGTEIRNIAAYFKVQKPHSFIVKKEEDVNQNDAPKKRVSTVQNTLPAKSTNCDEVDIVALAKENQLGKLKVKQLSDWLKGHSIPHNQRAKKEDLIHKILAHIRTTQPLQKYRV